MVNMKALGKAMQFLLLPTLAFLILVFCWFFNWGQFLAFVTSTTAWAGFLRVLVFVTEIVLVYYMYCYYAKRYPDDGAAKKIAENLLGENYTHVSSTRSTSYRDLPSFGDNSLSAMREHLNIPNEGTYKIGVYALRGVTNCVILKAIKE